MIVEVLLNVISSVSMFIFQIMPDLPPMPEVITDGIAMVSDMIVNVLGVFSYILTPALFIFGMLASLVVVNMKAIYHFIMFVARKLPIGTK